MSKKPLPLNLVARHEAGHAVMAFALGCTVRCVLISEDDGYVMYRQGRGRRPDPMIDGVISWSGVMALGPTRFFEAAMAEYRARGLVPEKVEPLQVGLFDDVKGRAA